MRICLIASADSIHTRRWIDALVPRCEIDLLSYTPSHAPPPEGVNLVDLTQLGWRAAIPRFRFAYWGLWIRDHLRQRSADLLHAHQVTGAGWLGSMTGFHPFLVSAWGSDLLRDPERNPLRNTLVRHVLSRSDCLVVPSVALERRARELGIASEKIRSLPWETDTAPFSPEPDDREATRTRLGIPLLAPTIFCPRALTPLYRIHVLLDATSQLVRTIPRLRLVLIRYLADASYEERLRTQIEKRSLGQHVVWLPEQSEQAMARLYRASDVAVSIPASEGFGRSVFEAMAAGCPTVVTDLPAFASQESGATLRVPVDDVHATAHAIQRVLSDVNLRARLARENRSRSAQPAPLPLAERAWSLYREWTSAP